MKVLRRYIKPEMKMDVMTADAVMTPIALAASSSGPKVGNEAPKRVGVF